ncbi:MAG: DUF6174 domain-containing protein [Actinomycetota bacterium]|jgi:hypothetical protein|nr:DUF6174 domain-containing protein [Actinomycetota bacterium]
MSHRPLALLIALLLFAAACSDDPEVNTVSSPNDQNATPSERLATARLLWADNGPASYELTTQELCFCPETVWTDTVVDGEVVSHDAATDEAFFDPGPRTMESLFDEVAAIITDDFASLDLEFDTETGALVRYWVDIDERIADEEHGVDVRSLEPTG